MSSHLSKLPSDEGKTIPGLNGCQSVARHIYSARASACWCDLMPFTYDPIRQLISKTSGDLSKTE